MYKNIEDGVIFFEGIIFENPNLRNDWIGSRPYPDASIMSIPHKPEGVRTNGVDETIYTGYRMGLDSACVDIVITTRLEDGTPAVLMSRRKDNVCYGGMWWIYGGALQAYKTIDNFIADRAKKECGIIVSPQALIGVYRTMSYNLIGSTIQLCYVTTVPVSDIQSRMVTDDGHIEIRLFTLKDLPPESNEEYHQYVLRVSKIALSNMP
jgi:ADP-ribose pyrophosphatase YjhB (NUDIX family)